MLRGSGITTKRLFDSAIEYAELREATLARLADRLAEAGCLTGADVGGCYGRPGSATGGDADNSKVDY
jgi:hypothetical protein